MIDLELNKRNRGNEATGSTDAFRDVRRNGSSGSSDGQNEKSTGPRKKVSTGPTLGPRPKPANRSGSNMPDILPIERVPRRRGRAEADL